MDANEREIEEGIAIAELKRSEGWQVLMGHVQAEIAKCVADQRAIEISGRPLQEIATDYISVTQRINGLNRVLEIANEIEERKERAVAP